MIPNHIEYCINNYIANKYTDYRIENIIPGHFGYNKIMKNPVFKISSNNNVVYLLYCENNCVCELDDKSYMILMSYKDDYKTKNGKYITFYRSGNGYIYASNKLMIHQIIMNLYGQGCFKTELSIDHIDRNPLNNKYNNLRIVDYKTQQENKRGQAPGTKRYRNCNAQTLPVEINHSDMPKYVYYCTERRNKGKYNEHVREFFRIEKHPYLQKIGKKCISSTKSCAINIYDKLMEIKNKLKYLDNEYQNYLNGPTID